MAEHAERPPSRARPVTDLPLDTLQDRAEQLARGWAAALVLSRPLPSLGRISLDEVGTGAAALCRQVIRALGDDAELARLLDAAPPEGGLPLLERPAALSGATGAAGVIDAVESLRGVLWEALLEEIGAEGEQAARAGDRLAHVCAELGARAVERGRAAGGRPWRFPERPPERPPGPPSEPEPRVVIVDEQASESPERPPGPQRGAGDPGTEALAAGAEQGSRVGEGPEPGAAALGQGAPVGDGSEAGAPGVAPARTRPAGDGSELRAPAAFAEERPPAAEALTAGDGADRLARAGAAPPGADRQIEIRDTRREEGPAAWIRSIGARLARHEADGLPFAVVLLSVTPVQPGAPLPSDEELEAALAEQLAAAGGGSLTREREGRWWVVASRVDAIGAHDLALRLERAAGAVAARAGTPVRVAAGTALAPEDGTDAPALAAHADVGLYASRRVRETP